MMRIAYNNPPSNGFTDYARRQLLHVWGEGPDRVHVHVLGILRQVFILKQGCGRVRARAYDIAFCKGLSDLHTIYWDKDIEFNVVLTPLVQGKDNQRVNRLRASAEA